MELTVQKRDITGKAVRNLRKEGIIPGELYGHGLKNIHVSVQSKDFRKIFKEAGESTLINLVLDDKKHPVMIHDVALNPVTDEVIAVDFYQVKLDEKITVNVPLNFIGESPAVKEQDGILVKAMQEIEVEALPNKIPHRLDVDISGIKDIDQSFYVKDLITPEGVEVLAEIDLPIATVTIKSEEEEVPTGEIDLEAVKVEGEDKVQERQAKKEGDQPKENTQESS